MRAVEEKTFRTHDGVDLFYRYWPAVAERGPRRDRPVPSRPRAFRPHGASRRRTRPAGLRRLRLGCARPRPLARRARLQPEPRHVGARRADLRRSHRRDLRHRGRRHGGHRAERRRGAGRDLGARLRAEHPLHGARLAGLQGEALRAVRAQRPEAHAEAARPLLRQLLRQAAVPHARSRSASRPSTPIR